MRALVAVLTVLVLASAAPAHAQILSEEDAAELAQSLAEAKDAQGVCYGWRVAIDDENSVIVEDAGSSLGPGQPLVFATGECPRYVVLNASVDYTSELSEAEDSASWSIDSNLKEPPTVGELRDLGHSADGLLGEEDDAVLANAVGALPLLVADHGEAKPVGFAPGDLPPEQAGSPTGNPGSDILRESWALLLICVLLLVGGLIWLVATLRAPRSPTTDPGGP